MKLNISRISNTKYDEKSFEKFTCNLLKEKETFIKYKLDETKSGNIRLVFKNLNYIKMLIKEMSGTISYSVLFMFMAIVTSFIVNKVNPYNGADFTNTSLVIIVIGILFILWMLFNSSVPYVLIFHGVVIYEKNLFGKTIGEFNPLKIESSNSEQFEKDYISLSTQKGESFMTTWELLIILDDDNHNGKSLLDKYFNSFDFENSINKD